MVRQEVVWVGVLQLLPAASRGSHGPRSTNTRLHPSLSSLGSSLTSGIFPLVRIFTVSILVPPFALQDRSFSVTLLCGTLFFPGCLSPALPHLSGLCAVTQHVISSKLVLVLYLLVNERIWDTLLLFSPRLIKIHNQHILSVGSFSRERPQKSVWGWMAETNLHSIICHLTVFTV